MIGGIFCVFLNKISLFFRNNPSPVQRPAPTPPIPSGAGGASLANRQAPLPPRPGVVAPGGPMPGGGPPIPIQNRPLPGPPGSINMASMQQNLPMAPA